MQYLSLGALAGAGAQSSINLSATPFMPGHSVVVVGEAQQANTVMSVQVQTSPDDTTWTTVATLTYPGMKANIELDNYIRVNNVTATGGNVGAGLLANL